MSNILNTIGFLSQQILRLEKAINKEVTLNKAFQQLLTVPCIGLILAMTIMLEVGDIGRFPQVGDPPMEKCRFFSGVQLPDQGS